MKNVLKWVGIAFVVLILIGVVTGKDDETKKTNTANDQATTTVTASESSDEVTESDKKDYKIGDVVKVGNLEYTVNEVSNAKQVGNEFLNEKASGVFLLVNITVKNNDKEAKTIDTSMFTLVESDGTQYDANATAAAYIEGNDDFFLANVNPKLSKTGYVIFDVPTVDSSYALKASGGFLSSDEELINLKSE